MGKLRLTWEKNGRSMVAIAGRLSLQVKVAPSEYLGQERHWKIVEIFGNHWLDPGAPRASYPTFEAAALKAEEYGRLVLKQALDSMKRTKKGTSA